MGDFKKTILKMGYNFTFKQEWKFLRCFVPQHDEDASFLSMTKKERAIIHPLHPLHPLPGVIC